MVDRNCRRIVYIKNTTQYYYNIEQNAILLVCYDCFCISFNTLDRSVWFCVVNPILDFQTIQVG